MPKTQELATLLQLDNPEVLFSRTPDSVDGTAIHKALAEAARQMQDGPTQNLASLRLQVLAAAGKILLAAPAQYAEAIHLTRFAVLGLADSAPLAHVRLIALGGLRLRQQLVAEVVRLSDIHPADAQMSEVIRTITAKYGLQHVLPSSMALFNALWGALPEDLQGAIVEMKANPDPQTWAPERALRYLHDHSRLERCSYAEFKHRYSWGVMARNYLHFIAQLQATGASPHEMSRVSELQAQIRTTVMLPFEVKTLTEEHRNILIMVSHAGMPVYFNMNFIAKSPIPTSVIGRNAGKGAGTSFNVSTSAPDAPMNFLKLVKLLRKEPRLTLIYADGGMGELADIDVLGVKMQIGRGSALLGYHGRAITAFVCTRWEGDSVRIVLNRGPSPQSDETLEDFEQRLNSFYAASLEDVLSGPPEDIGMLLAHFNAAIAKGLLQG